MQDPRDFGRSAYLPIFSDVGVVHGPRAESSPLVAPHLAQPRAAASGGCRTAPYANASVDALEEEYHALLVAGRPVSAAAIEGRPSRGCAWRNASPATGSLVERYLQGRGIQSQGYRDQAPLNQRVQGSSPCAPTIKSNT